MAFDESLYVTARFTTARGLSLSKQSNALTIKDTSNDEPRTYDIYVDQNRGGVTLPNQIDGKFIKKPLSLYLLFKEQYPNAQQRNGDIYNLHIAPNIAVVGTRESPYSGMFYANEFENSLINMDNNIDQLMLKANPLTLQDPYSAIEQLIWKHSAGQYAAVNNAFDLKFHKRYGRFVFNFHAYHGNGTCRLLIYNADGTLSSDQILSVYNNYIDIAKGQFASVAIQYTPTRIDSKNNVFMGFSVRAVNGIVPPALFIGSNFNNNHTINIYNKGYILGKGGDGTNYTPPRYSSDLWNQQIDMVVQEGFVRNQGGGDAILAADVGVVNIYNDGIISGGGAAANYGYTSGSNGNATYYAAPGGAPLGKGTITYIRYSAAGGGGVLPFIYGNDAGLTTPAAGSPIGANIGQSVINRASSGGGLYNFAGMFYRGCRNANFYGNGQYKGPSCFTTQLVDLVG